MKEKFIAKKMRNKNNSESLTWMLIRSRSFLSSCCLTCCLEHKTTEKKWDDTRTGKVAKQFLVEFIAIFPKCLSYEYSHKNKYVDCYSTPDKIFKIFCVNFIIISHCELFFSRGSRWRRCMEHFKTFSQWRLIESFTSQHYRLSEEFFTLENLRSSFTQHYHTSLYL